MTAFFQSFRQGREVFRKKGGEKERSVLFTTSEDSNLNWHNKQKQVFMSLRPIQSVYTAIQKVRDCFFVVVVVA